MHTHFGATRSRLNCRRIRKALYSGNSAETGPVCRCAVSPRSRGRGGPWWANHTSLSASGRSVDTRGTAGMIPV
jgi:hypothetical protein